MAANSYVLDFNGYWLEPNVGGVPTGSGIYSVYACRYDARANTVAIGRLLYIGEAENVKARIAGHERWSDWTRELKVGETLCFNAAPISPAGARQRAEAAMIFHHKPPCNVEYAHSFPFDTTAVSTSGNNELMSSSFTVRAAAARGGLAGATLLGR
ncbi:MAG TPA: GIY-YIG nuclease family protein [Hyphomonas sp.]|nr:hypothetical protein [Hyphomonas sp.]HRJ01750.1 GIY-YIG nuclease family protein [Hyphomonas sp.]